jgi:hypothetical protein
MAVVTARKSQLPITILSSSALRMLQTANQTAAMAAFLERGIASRRGKDEQAEQARRRVEQARLAKEAKRAAAAAAQEAEKKRRAETTAAGKKKRRVTEQVQDEVVRDSARPLLANALPRPSR